MACNVDVADIEDAKMLRSLPAESATVGNMTSSRQNASACSQNGCGACDSLPTAAARAYRRPTCMKCKSNLAVVAVRQKEPLCADCAYTSAVNKVRGALRLRMGVKPSDCVLVCLSGGSSSRAMLQLLQDVRSSNKQLHDKGKIAFDLLVVHIEEGSAHGLTEEESASHSKRIWRTVEGCLPAESYTSAVIEDVFLDPSSAQQTTRAQRRDRLQQLLAAVPDSTGREDLIESLRNIVLMSTAARLGATKLARGDSSTKLAMRVLATSAKGAGYALPSTLHFVDARHGPGRPVWINPVRELTAKDLAMLCHFGRLQTAQLPVLRRQARQPSINALAEAFVAGLQATLPSTVNTVLGTACKLQAFSWNSANLGVEIGRNHPQGASSGHSDVLCAICSSPFDADEQAGLSEATFAAACCRVCQQQMMGAMSRSGRAGGRDAVDEPAVLEKLLPTSMREHAAVNVKHVEGIRHLSREEMQQKIGSMLLVNDDLDDR